MPLTLCQLSDNDTSSSRTEARKIIDEIKKTKPGTKSMLSLALKYITKNEVNNELYHSFYKCVLEDMGARHNVPHKDVIPLLIEAWKRGENVAYVFEALTTKGLVPRTFTHTYTACGLINGDCFTLRHESSKGKKFNVFCALLEKSMIPTLYAFYTWMTSRSSFCINLMEYNTCSMTQMFEYVLQLDSEQTKQFAQCGQCGGLCLLNTFETQLELHAEKFKQSDNAQKGMLRLLVAIHQLNLGKTDTDAHLLHETIAYIVKCFPTLVQTLTPHLKNMLFEQEERKQQFADMLINGDITMLINGDITCTRLSKWIGLITDLDVQYSEYLLHKRAILGLLNTLHPTTLALFCKEKMIEIRKLFESLDAENKEKIETSNDIKTAFARFCDMSPLSVIQQAEFVYKMTPDKVTEIFKTQLKKWRMNPKWSLAIYAKEKNPRWNKYRDCPRFITKKLIDFEDIVKRMSSGSPLKNVLKNLINAEQTKRREYIETLLVENKLSSKDFDVTNFIFYKICPMKILNYLLLELGNERYDENERHVSKIFRLFRAEVSSFLIRNPEVEIDITNDEETCGAETEVLSIMFQRLLKIQCHSFIDRIINILPDKIFQCNKYRIAKHVEHGLREGILEDKYWDAIELKKLTFSSSKILHLFFSYYDNYRDNYRQRNGKIKIRKRLTYILNSMDDDDRSSKKALVLSKNRGQNILFHPSVVHALDILLSVLDDDDEKKNFVNYVDLSGETPFMKAIRTGNVTLMGAFLNDCQQYLDLANKKEYCKSPLRLLLDKLRNDNICTVWYIYNNDQEDIYLPAEKVIFDDADADHRPWDFVSYVLQNTIKHPSITMNEEDKSTVELAKDCSFPVYCNMNDGRDYYDSKSFKYYAKSSLPVLPDGWTCPDDFDKNAKVTTLLSSSESKVKKKRKRQEE